MDVVIRNDINKTSHKYEDTIITYKTPNKQKIRENILKYLYKKDKNNLKKTIDDYGHYFDMSETFILEKYDTTSTLEVYNIKRDLQIAINSVTIYQYLSGRIDRFFKNIDINDSGNDILEIASINIAKVIISVTTPDIMNFILSNIKYTSEIFNCLYNFLMFSIKFSIIDFLRFQVEKNKSFIKSINRIFSQESGNFGMSLFDSIIPNSSLCNKFRNQETLTGETWDEVFSNRSDAIVYFDKKSEYGFLIESLLKYWNNKFNSCSHLVTPCCPTHPYTMERISFSEVYRICFISLRFDKQIPNTLKQLIIFPELLKYIENLYRRLNDYQDIDSVIHEYTRDKLYSYNFEYTPVTNNEDDVGEWNNKDPLIKDYYLTETKLKLYYLKYIKLNTSDDNIMIEV